MDVAGAALGFEVGAHVFDGDVTGAGGGGEAGSVGKGDVVVDANVAVQIRRVALANDNVVTGLDNGRVADDLLDARVDVAAHPAVAGMKVGDDVNLAVGAGVEMDIARTGRDGDAGGAAGVEGAVEVAVGGKGCGGGQGEDGGG